MTKFPASVRLTPDGRLVISAVFPIIQNVEYLPNKRNFERIPVPIRATFEDQFSQFITRFVEPHGFELEAWTKTPYISQGSKQNPYHVLENATMVFHNF